MYFCVTPFLTTLDCSALVGMGEGLPPDVTTSLIDKWSFAVWLAATRGPVIWCQWAAYSSVKQWLHCHLTRNLAMPRFARLWVLDQEAPRINLQSKALLKSLCLWWLSTSRPEAHNFCWFSTKFVYLPGGTPHVLVAWSSFVDALFQNLTRVVDIMQMRIRLIYMTYLRCVKTELNVSLGKLRFGDALCLQLFELP